MIAAMLRLGNGALLLAARTIEPQSQVIQEPHLLTVTTNQQLYCEEENRMARADSRI